MQQNDIIAFNLGGSVYAYINIYKDEPIFHIRKYIISKNAKFYPTKIGISMKEDRFATFVDKLDEIKHAVDKVRGNFFGEYERKIHVGAGLNVLLESGWQNINFRYFFLPEGQDDAVPSRSGIAINFKQWDELLKDFEQIKNPPMQSYAMLFRAIVVPTTIVR